MNARIHRARPLAGLALCAVACCLGCRTTTDPAEWALARAVHLPEPESRFGLVPLGEFFAVEAELEGLGPYPLLLDTGSGLFLVADEIGDALLQKQPRETGPVVAEWLGERQEIGRFFRVSTARLGTVTLQDVAVNAVGFGDWVTEIGRSPRGIVGPRTFRDLFLSIDFRSGEMRVSRRPPAALPPPTAAVPFRWELGTVRAEIAVGGVKTWAVIDSGSSLGLQVPRRQSFPIRGDWQRWGIARDLHSTKHYSVAELDAAVTIGDTVLPQPWVYSSPEFPQVNVGMEVLRHFRLTLDTKNARLWLEGPAEGALVVAQPEPQPARPPTPP